MFEKFDAESDLTVEEVVKLDIVDRREQAICSIAEDELSEMELIDKIKSMKMHQFSDLSRTLRTQSAGGDTLTHLATNYLAYVLRRIYDHCIQDES